MNCLDIDLFRGSPSYWLLSIGLLIWAFTIYWVWKMWRTRHFYQKQKTDNLENALPAKQEMLRQIIFYFNLGLGNPLGFFFIWIFFIPWMVFLSYPVIYGMQGFVCIGHHS